MKLGLFGGTFDPPHIGHRIVAQDVLAALRLDRIVFIPAARPPHKRRADLTPAPLRLAMLRAALAGDDRFAIDDLELHRAGPSYTVDTLAAFRERDPAADLHLIIGADQFAELETWHEAGRIRTLALIVVMTRAGTGTGTGAGEGAAAGTGTRAGRFGGVHEVLVTRVDVSSTALRERVRKGESVRYLVPAGVEEIIRRERLYGAGAG